MWLSHVALRVRNVERAVDFYTHIVGLKLHDQRHGAAFLGVREETSHELALFELGEHAAEPDPERVGMYRAPAPHGLTDWFLAVRTAPSRRA